MWILLLLLYAILSYTEILPAGIIIVNFMNTCGIVGLLTGTGVFFAVRCRKTSTAVMAAAILTALVVMLEAFIFWLMMELFMRYWYDYIETLILISPLGGLEGDYRELFPIFILITLINLAFGYMFTLIAKGKVRKVIF